MGRILSGFIFPTLLLSAGLLNWSLISFVNLLISLVFRFVYPKRGFQFRGRGPFFCFVLIFSVLVILLELTFLSLCTIDSRWSIQETYWIKLIGLMKIKSWRSPTAIYFLVLEILVGALAFFEINRTRLSFLGSENSFWSSLSSVLEQIGHRVRFASCLLLPAVQLASGIINPSWLSLPFFICSCIGLVDWSLTSNFLGLFRWWKLLWIYSSVGICLLYIYQLPIGFPQPLEAVAEAFGLFKLSMISDLQEICSSIFVLAFFFMLSCVRHDLDDMEFVMSMTEGSLTEQLLPSQSSFFVRQLRSGVRHTNVLLRGTVFRFFSINWFTYGFPISLFALSYWSFHFASICAFGLLAYVGYILYAFPSFFQLHRLNGLLLVFILLWAVSTYIFNVVFAYVNWKAGKDMEIWEIVGLWHYPIPAFFLLAQFCLGILVALGNLVNNSVLLCLSNEEAEFSNDNNEVKEDTKVLIVATIAWVLRKCSRPIMLLLIFLIATKPGIIHALYMIFFFAYLLSNNIDKRMGQALILLCETYFAVLYIIQLNLVSKVLERQGSVSSEILHHLGLLECERSWEEFMEITLLAVFCAINNRGFEMLFSFSAIAQRMPSRPFGFSILKAGLNKSVLLSVYATSSTRDHSENHSHERRIAVYLSSIGKKFLLVYRSFGTYIAFVTVLLALYFERPNCISFGYIFLLLFWIVGRQLVEKTKRRLWFPLKAYAVTVFVFIYALSILPTFKEWMSSKINLEIYFGYDPEASLLENLWESLAIVIVMQLYSYERKQSELMKLEVVDEVQFGILGFTKRVLIWHSQKILLAMLFYASLSPISLFGFLYLVGLICSCALPKTSRIPSKVFLIYTSLLLLVEYLFQMWGDHAEMFPGQVHQDLFIFLGLHLYKQGFEGLEAGLRPKVLVIASCALQYNVFVWMEAMQKNLLNAGKSQEPCPMFLSEEDISGEISRSNGEKEILLDSSQLHSSGISSNLWGSFVSEDTRPSESSSYRKYSLGFMWGSLKESAKWNKKRVAFLRQERFAMQKKTLKVYLKFWTENLFNLFGLEINMLALLLASFALLNVISMFYILCLAMCVLLGRPIIRKLWPGFVILFAMILVAEYVVMWRNMLSYSASSDTNVHCHDCWKNSKKFFQYCEKCWLGIIVDDPFVLTSYFIVFMLACYKLRADFTLCFSWLSTYHMMFSQRKLASVWRDLSFETKGMWTFLDYMRVYCYCHLLDLVLALVLFTGTMEYDILHLGYLGFALFFFRSRFSILKKKNKVFKYLRIYNFAVIVLSLAYQSPFVGDFSAGKCDTVDYIYEVIGFYKYDYGFQITSRSALVEIIIFVLVSCQSYMFSSSEFDYVFRYLEAEQIGAIVREQEKKATWKTEQLQRVRESEERKKQRNLQVEKMKSEMLNLQSHLQGLKSSAAGDNTPAKEGLRRRRTASYDVQETENAEEHDSILNPDPVIPFNIYESPRAIRDESPLGLEFFKHPENASSEITEIWEDASDVDFNELDKAKRLRSQSNENPLASAVQLIGDCVSQVQSIGNQAVSNLMSFLNIIPEEVDSNDPHSTLDELPSDVKNIDIQHSESSASSMQYSESTSMQIGWIIRHMWYQMRSNNDIVCYCCFVLVFLWNFSLLSMVYLASLFMYALCVNTGPSYIFWVVILIYTEIYVLVQYLYQIMIQHCGFTIQSDLLCKLGFPKDRIKSSFVVCLLPLFLVYLFTLIQSSITAKDGEWFSIGFSNGNGGMLNRKRFYLDSSRTDKAKRVFQLAGQAFKIVISSCSRYWKSLTQEAESPPYFVQLSLDVEVWPEDGIQPERIESGINELLKLLHADTCRNDRPKQCSCASKVQIRSIDKSPQNASIALAVFEVVYVSSSTECTPLEKLISLTPASDVAKEITRAKNLGLTKEVGFPYSILSVIGGGKREVDLYAYVFGADLSVFFLVSIFYQSVIKNKSEFLEYYQLEDQFPKEYVFILMVLFFLIVVDRIIYLCSFAMGKVIFFVFNFILFTYAVTEYAWNMNTSQQNAAGLALRAIYLTKAISFALQAIQIRYGVPHQSTLYRQFLTSEVSHVNYLGYRLYRALPFLYELRCVLDWSCTTTSLTMYDWLKLEDINASLYLVKCDNDLNRAKHKHGEKQTKMTKFCNGICLFFILICVIWAPMLMYSSGNPTNIANPVNDASFQLDIKTTGGRLTFYQTTLCERIPWDSLSSNLNLDPGHYLDSYNVDDIQLLCCQADASALWLIPSVVQKQFIRSLSSGSLDMMFSWLLTRDRPKGKETVKYERSVNPSNLPSSSEIVGVLNGSLNSFRIKSIYPRSFRVTGSGEVRTFESEVNDVTAELTLHHESPQWWSFHDVNSSDAYGCGGLSGPMAVVVSEETPQGFLGETLSKFSIWGLYITFVLAVGRFIRMQCSDLRMRIPYENLPSCDRLIGICEDIYAARAEGELGVEEVLYWSLVKIYRSPHILLEYTKQPD